MNEKNPSFPSDTRSPKVSLVAMLALVLGFGLMGGPFPSSVILLIVAVPLMTFVLAAPGRISLVDETKTAAREFETLLLSFILLLRRDSIRHSALKKHHRKRVEKHYRNLFKDQASHSSSAIDRFHFGNHLANLSALWLMVLGLTVPVSSQGFTFGPFWAAPFVIFLDGLLLWMGCRIVMSRIAIRLWEATLPVKHDDVVGRSFNALWLPFAGGVFGALGGIVVGQAMAIASVMETIWLFPQSALWATFQNTVLSFAFMGFIPATICGALIGAMLNLSLAKKK